MSMTRKDFKLIAINLALYAKPHMAALAYNELVTRLAFDLDDSRSQFNAEKFIKACGLETCSTHPDDNK